MSKSLPHSALFLLYPYSHFKPIAKPATRGSKRAAKHALLDTDDEDDAKIIGTSKPSGKDFIDDEAEEAEEEEEEEEEEEFKADKEDGETEDGETKGKQ